MSAFFFQVWEEQIKPYGWGGMCPHFPIFVSTKIGCGSAMAVRAGLGGAWRSPFLIFVLLKSDLGCRCIEQRKVRATLSHHTS